MERVPSIKEKLHLLKKWDKGLNFFGASTHGYTLKPVLSEIQLKRFEQTHNVLLPTEYRLFLANVCNGLAGPNYGLRSLEKSALPPSLSSQFPHTNAWNMEKSESMSDEEFAEAYYANHLINGALGICTAGCYELILVVSGSQKGEIWCDDRSSDGGIYPISNRFFDWYENWLDGNLKKCPEFWITPPSFAD